MNTTEFLLSHMTESDRGLGTGNHSITPVIINKSCFEIQGVRVSMGNLFPIRPGGNQEFSKSHIKFLKAYCASCGLS